jgi:hypothetical protein
MPFYEVQHFIPLEKSERDELAKTITHTRKFTTPSAFVNAQFTEISQHHNYVAGKEVRRVLRPRYSPACLLTDGDVME